MGSAGAEYSLSHLVRAVPTLVVFVVRVRLKPFGLPRNQHAYLSPALSRIPIKNRAGISCSYRAHHTANEVANPR